LDEVGLPCVYLEEDLEFFGEEVDGAEEAFAWAMVDLELLGYVSLVSGVLSGV
jgi:hypothetical protein